MEKFNLYGNEFSLVYDRFWNDFIDEIGPQIRKIFLKYSKTEVNKAKVLDLFCGTGKLIKILCGQGFSVIGLDQSTSMLRLAKRKLLKEITEGRVRLVEGLAQQFNLEEKFDLVVSTFDSINHLTNLEDVRSCFTNVFNHLNETGCFIFDLNTRDVLTNWNFIDLDESEDKSMIYIMHGIYDPGDDKAYTRVIGFIDEKGEGNYKRFDEIVFNSLFELADIIEVLHEVGFSDLVIYDSSLQNIITNTKNFKDRLFIVAYL